jgi:hypothetical protein
MPPSVASDKNPDNNKPNASFGGTSTPAPSSQGYLTVRSKMDGTSIAIRRIGTFTDQVADLPCPPGNYEVTSNRPYFTTQVSSVTINPGQHAQLDIKLSLDYPTIQRSLNEATQQVAGNDPQRAVKTAREVLAADPINSMARTILTLAYFSANDMANFYESAQEALRKGSIVYVVLVHRDNNVVAPLRQGLVVLRQNSIFFMHDLNEVKSDLPQRTVPLRPNDVAEVVRDNSGQVYLSLKLHGDHNSAQSKETISGSLEPTSNGDR